MFSTDQKDTARFAGMNGSLSLSVGSKRAGKTTAAVGAFYAYTQALEEPYKHCIGGRKLRVIEGEILPKIEAAAKVLGTPYTYNRADNIAYVGNQRYDCVAGNDENSEARIRGLTLHSALCDEVTEVPQSYWNMLTFQMTHEGGKCWAMTNPAGPLHWLKRDWLDEGKFHQHVQYHLDRAHFIPEERKQAYRDMYSGAFYLRFYEGEWAANEGLIFPDWTVASPPADARLVLTVIGVDYGIASPSAFVVLQQYRQGNLTTYHVPKVEYVEAPETDSQLAKRLLELSSQWNAKAVILDPSALSLRLELQRSPGRRFAVRKADNAVIPGIRLTQNALAQGKITIGPEATERLQLEFGTYAWEPERDDTPIKENDHACDALRYASMNIVKTPALETVKIPPGM